MPSYTLPGGTIKFESEKTNGRYQALVFALSGGNSALSWSLTGESKGDTLTLETDGTKSFGAKPVADKPWLVWIADEGESPTSLGRRTTFDDGSAVLDDGGQFGTSIVGPGQSQSHNTDLGVDGTSFKALRAPATRKKLVCRRRYDEFDYRTAEAIRTRIDLASGDPPTAGQTVTGQTSGATGVVQSVEPDGLPTYAVFYEPTGGTINDDPPTDFEWDETMSWTGGSGTNSEGSEQFPTGTYRTFNNKVIRFWPLNRTSNYINVYAGEGPDGRWAAEFGGGLINDTTELPVTHSQDEKANTWVTDTFRFIESSDIDITDASFYWKKNQKEIAPGTTGFTSKTTTYPDSQETLYMHQVSNGAQPGSRIHLDYLYIDDSYYYVVIRDNNSGREMPLPVLTWADQKIELYYLPYETWTHIDVYKDGVLEGSAAR